MIKCQNCGNESPDDAVFCDQCGARLKPAPEQVADAPAPAQPSGASAQPAVEPVTEPAAPVAEPAGRCPDCGAVNTPGEMYCSECGAPLEAPEPDQDAQISPEPEIASQPAAAPGANTCPFCGTVLPAGETFCPSCGAEAGGVATAVNTDTTPAPAPEPQPSAPPAAEPAPSAPVAPAAECPACGARVNPGDTFCEFCGAALVGAGAPAAAPAAATPASPSVTAVGTARFVLSKSGIEIPLPPGEEIIVGREDPYTGVYPDVDLTPHGGEEGGVSRRHFRLLRSAAGYTIEDLNSTNLTYLNKAKIEPGHPTKLADGDQIRAGRITLIFKE